MKKRSKTFLLTLPLISLFNAQLLQASTLVYEGFNYGGSDGAIHGQAIGGGAFGLSGSYTTVTQGLDGPSGNTLTSNYISSGLSLSNISTTGGALETSIVTNRAEVKEGLYSHASLSLGSAATGTIYRTMLGRISENTFAVGNPFAEARIQSSASITGNSNGSMGVAPKGNFSGTRPSIGYDGSTSHSGSSLALDTTYLFVSKYTNVGSAGGGTASLWILNESDYDAWQLSGGTEGTIEANATVTASKTDPSQIDFDNTKSLRFASGDFSVDFNSGSTAYSSNGELTVIYDEIRFGTSLNDVVVVTIPEPSTLSMLLLSGCGLLSLWRIRRKR
ncbi:PEP-CTERM sorting domain-containing protein [Kiritimatiellaeota bacterium B1221]|nr:PEP-CTERM sorting domain-containing protein [Kiritimatiellaeota bacterium B1221]